MYARHPMLNVEQGGMSRECILKIKVNPNTTFYSYYFFPRAPRSDFEVLFVCFFRQATPPQATRQKAKTYAYCRRWLRIAHFFCNFIALFQYL